jgi:membrane dipeptidase
MGFRIIQLTYNERNFIGDGCLEAGNAGLSKVGVAMVKAMNRAGILVDLSHCGLRTCREAIDASDKPVAFTHANPSAVTPSPRNKPDDLIRAVAETGGVIGMTAYSPLAVWPDGGWPDLTAFANMIDYCVSLVGIDHVGVGTDHVEDVYERDYFEQHWGNKSTQYKQVTNVGPWYGFDTKNVKDFGSASQFGNVAEALDKKGYKAADIDKVLGGNFMRLFAAVWQ